MTEIEQLIGVRFGRLVVLSESERQGQSMYKALLCKCDCGNETKVALRSLKSGSTRSCGCLQKEITSKTSTKHGLRTHPLYYIWNGMKDRCYNPNCSNYKNYGARGIIVSNEWKNSFVQFYNDMQEAYKKGLELDRINSDQNYCKENCKWSTRTEQNNNKRNNVIITIDGENLPIDEFCKRFDLSKSTVRHRIKSGKTIDEIISKDNLRWRKNK